MAMAPPPKDTGYGQLQRTSPSYRRGECAPVYEEMNCTRTRNALNERSQPLDHAGQRWLSLFMVVLDGELAVP